MITVIYTCRKDDADLVEHESVVNSHEEVCQIVDNYPWSSELVLSEEMGEGGGFWFILGNPKNKSATYQLVPMEHHKGLLDLSVVLKPGFMNLFGKKTVSKSFDLVAIEEVKAKVKELFDHSVDSLYKKYKTEITLSVKNI
ncbi:hypothetical protein CHISP_2572 [Chitinispirillum alkaliphilum]|nr:hypothetical protein CHISP_2572 [Chitinispirillum alkaliphilum]